MSIHRPHLTISIVPSTDMQQEQPSTPRTPNLLDVPPSPRSAGPLTPRSRMIAVYSNAIRAKIATTPSHYQKGKIWLSMHLLECCDPCLRNRFDGWCTVEETPITALKGRIKCVTRCAALLAPLPCCCCLIRTCCCPTSRVAPASQEMT